MATVSAAAGRRQRTPRPGSIPTSSPRAASSWHPCLVLALLLGTYGVTQCDALEAYYPTSRLHLSLPISKESYIILRNHPLLNLATTPRDIANGTTSDYRYAIESPAEGFLNIDATTGDVWIESHIMDLPKTTEFIISASSGKSSEVLRLSLTITPVPVEENNLPRFCEDHVDQICFWQAATYRIAENESTGFRVGPLGPQLYQQLCRTYSVKYELTNGTQYLVERNGTLFSNGSLDHESDRPGPTLQAGVRCTVRMNGNSVPLEVDKMLEIAVLDRNDNRPRLEHVNDTYIELILDDPIIQKNQKLAHLNVLFLDNDTIAANSHVHYQLLNDTMELFQPKCVTYELPATRQTVFSCSLEAQHSGILPKGRYCVTLRAVDETFPAELLTSNDQGSSTICITPNHDRIQLPQPEALVSPDHPATPEAKPARGKKRSGTKAAAILANFRYDPKVTLYNSTSRFARVAVPSNFYDQLNETKIDLEYRIISNPLDAFEITKAAGIIYVKNTTIMHKQLPGTVLSLEVGWLNHNATIKVHLESNPGSSCNASVEEFCSLHSSKKSCEASCGIGSAEGSCYFRSTDASLLFADPSSFRETYPTCSPDLDFCPDNYCDPLEDMAYRENVQICPQDCVLPGNIFGVHESDKSRRRGLHMSTSTCTCRVTGQCDCVASLNIKPEHMKPRTKPPKTTSTTTEPVPMASGSNVTAGASVPAAVRDGTYYHTGLITGPHAPIYLLAIVIVPMIVAILLVSYCFTRKVSLKKKLVDADNIPMHLVSNDTEVFNVDLPVHSRMNDINFKIDFDTKWEFPRTSLILDITLGEGEFGKVVKGFATDLPERPGITTVAVKMLKTGANSVELLALLSEYQLLQEVAHPNVIRLLGACTKGDSPLLIIEYCQYGSLKNHLRLSRKLEIMNSADYENAIEPITVKDILSFAWQISKGMAYLTEIKLVHRDLAARNVLLAEGKVCKISDFGLTRDVYEDDAYLKKSKDRVPVKWMAPESLADHIYTTKSDVWAFGVLCWELITLGASPYPGIPPQNLYTLLKQGYRMDCPINCSEEIYSIVRSCWADDPKLRPSFKHLAGQFERLLGRTAKYIDMEQNSISNPVYCENKDETDCAQISFVQEEQARLESLWTTPQYEPATDASTIASFRYLSPITDKKTLLQSYDTPRPLIETATIEQKLRYENDVRLRPKKVGPYPASSATPTVYINSASNPNLLLDEETSFTTTEYDSPSRQPRRVSYMDMNKHSVNLNLEINNMVDKKQSKDIAFRFSSIDNNLQIVSGDSPTSPQDDEKVVIQIDPTDGDMVPEPTEGRDEVDFPCKVLNSIAPHELHSVTVTSTV